MHHTIITRIPQDTQICLSFDCLQLAFNHPDQKFEQDPILDIDSMAGLQATVAPSSTLVSSPGIHGLAIPFGATSGIKWHGPEVYQRNHAKQFPCKEVLLDYNHQQKERLMSPDGLTQEVQLEDAQQTDGVISNAGLEHEVITDDHQLKEDLSADSYLIKESKHHYDQHKEGLKSLTDITPKRKPETKYTEAQMAHLKDRIRYRTPGLNYKYDLQNDNFYEMDKSLGDLSGFFGQIKVYDSQCPDQLLYQTPYFYFNGRFRSRHQLSLGEHCLGLAPVYVARALWRAGVNHY